MEWDPADPSDVETWSEEYDANYDDDLRKIEDCLNESLPEQRYITRAQLERVVEWKLAAQPGRRDRNVERLSGVPDEFVRRVSEAALIVDDSKLQLKTLSSIPGIGNATATLVLAFYDPANYAIGDRYIVDALLGEDRAMRLTDYPVILDELRDQNPGNFDLRTVEKAYYQKYRDAHDVGRW